jgi:hypothetical protein
LKAKLGERELVFFVKMIKLYREVIITSLEFLTLTAPIITKISEELMNYVQELIYTREQIRREESSSFKSFQNLDTSSFVFSLIYKLFLDWEKGTLCY